jgi:hypothetical protein
LPFPATVPVEYGLNTAASNGLLITNPASTGAWGAWTPLSASTSHAFQAFHIAPQMNSSTNVSANDVNIEIGFGALGVETTVGGMSLTYNSAEYLAKKSMTGLIGASQIVPAGSRLVARYKRAGATQPLDLVVHGIKLV